MERSKVGWALAYRTLTSLYASMETALHQKMFIAKEESGASGVMMARAVMENASIQGSARNANGAPARILYPLRNVRLKQAITPKIQNMCCSKHKACSALSKATPFWHQVSPEKTVERF